ncbi:B3/4 domain-containing protein [Desemzia sp. RIT804]|uniref:B3/B4 domain-containing protein n=1 Tax=Desemzia sp. RIT 804 TaxID=2810209 RepID=UPI00195040BE|nr:B3/4 domain-containing protein [Desemzia sp. RIT 804]MBM6614841.1 B3/4 domain-containing protein [Desemzia sp. RIT 804]
MKRFVVEREFWDTFPEARINVLVVKGIDNHTPQEDEGYFIDLLRAGKEEAKKFLTEETFSKNSVIQEWREAFSQFKTKKGARSSIEALLKRVEQERDFHPINPLVDIYNSISLKYGLPCGGEDIQTIVGDLYLSKAKGGERFLPLGAEKDAPALPEEIIYGDDEGAICRCWNWREAQRTMLTENTSDAVLVIESMNPEQHQRAEKAVEELKNLVDTYFQIESKVMTLRKSNPVFDLEA